MLNAQRTAIYADKEIQYKLGLELFDKKQYVSAQKQFDDYAFKTQVSLLKSEATFYSAACAIELFNKDGEWQMKQFILKYPESNKINDANLYLGKTNFRKKKYADAIEFFNKVDLFKIEKEPLAELHFKRGYSYLENGNSEKAKSDFYEIKDIDNKYTFPALYYYSHISYTEKNYEIALEGFNRLISNETFGSVVPYYITQIYFIQNKYEKVITEAPKLLNDSANIQKSGEINRMIGESYFNLKDFENALKYFEKTELASGLNTQGNYVLGYCYYKTGSFEKAIQKFEKAIDLNDTLSQNAWYHIADCNINLNNKLKAKNAYYSAYKLNIDKKITEESLYSFAKLSYELDFSPYNDAIKAFQKYLAEYPNSPKKDECYTYLINVYSTTKNYAKAIESIENIKIIDPILKITYQKLIYFLGITYFNNGEIDKAEKEFNKSLKQNSDFQLNALCKYWLGEISYQRKDYSTAINTWKEFQETNGAASLKEYDISNYALGYAYFQRKEDKDYGNAQISFRKYLMAKNKNDDLKVNDATIRVADCYFMTRDYGQASENYETAIALNKLDLDYCIYQKAMCDGLTKNYKEKISELKKIESKYPKSTFLAPSINEIAETYLNNLKDDDNAILYYNKLLTNFPNSTYVSKCYAQLGNIYYTKKQDSKAFEYFDKYVTLNPGTEESNDVMESIKKIFQAKGDVDGIENYFASKGQPLSESVIEKTAYSAAFDLYYNQKNYAAGAQKWEIYLKKFPNGKSSTEAWACIGDYAYSQNQFDKALEAFKNVIAKPRNLFTENALSKSAYIYYKNKKYTDALPLYQQLEDIAELSENKSFGRFGSMRSAFYTQQFEIALSECIKVISNEKLTPQQKSEAAYIKAKSLFETGRLDDAMGEFKEIAKNAKNSSGAEAYYHIALIYFKKQDYKETEKSINKLLSYPYSNDDWNNKAMILLADKYSATNDYVNAKVFLQTVIDSKPKDEYVKQAQQKLEEINLKENALNNKNNANDNSMKVEFKQSKSDEKLFNNSNDMINKADSTKTFQPK
ncbi:MAG: tetratricopeptide repeat protein [Bacteroidetes bacterium]|nr:tetratricopeptide repeat protein [Bacteroidota bacterium]